MTEQSPRTPDGRVVMAITGLLLLVGIAVLAAVVLIVDLKQDTARLTDRQVGFVQGIHAAALDAKAVANNERGYLLTGRREFLVSLERSTKDTRAAFARASRAATSHSQTIAVENARAGFDRWVKALRAEIAMYQAGDRSGAIAASLERTRPLRKEYERGFSLALLIGTGAVEAETTSVLDASSRSVMFLLAYLAIALIAGGALAVWIVRVTAPVRGAHRSGRPGAPVTTPVYRSPPR